MLGLLIYVGVIAILSVGSAKRPAFSLGAVLCMFGLEQWGETKISFIATHSSFSNYVSFVIVAIGISIQLYRGRRPILGNGPIHASVILLFFYSAASLLWTPIPEMAIAEWRTQLPYVLLMLFVLPQLIQNAADARDGLLGTLIAGGILVICLAFLVEWGYRSIVSDVSAAGVIKLPLAIAQLGAYVFILAIMFRGRGVLNTLIAVGLVAISVLLVVKSGSRGQLIAMIATAALFAPMARGKTLSRGYIALLTIGASVGFAAWWALPGLSELVSNGQVERFSADRAVEDYEGRLAIAEALIDHYLSSGTLGMIFGLGSSASFSPQVVGFYTHIVPVEILCELGIVGAAIFLFILGLTLRSVGRYMTQLSNDGGSADADRVVAALVALFACELLLSLKEGSLLRDINLFLFPILIEGVLVRENSMRRNQKRRANMIAVPNAAIQS